MSIILVPPIPMQAPILQTGPDGKDSDYCSTEWYLTFFGQQQRLGNSPQVVSTPIPSLTAQSSSIGATDMPTGALTAGIYRVSWYARITQAASSSSTLTVTIAWTEGGAPQSASGVAMTGNTITTTQSQTIIVKADAASPLTYATTYGSVGGVAMQYTLIVTAEALG